MKGGKGKEMNMKRGGGPGMVQRYSKDLNLTKEQQEQIKKICGGCKDQMKGQREKNQQLRQNMEAQIKTVLTPDQLAKYEQMKPGMNGRKMEGKKGGKHKGPPPEPGNQ